jgi:protein-L-isoaspartate(D-aspartate) O-methyltransferase
MVDILSNYSPEHRVTDPKVLEAMRRVPRHEFVPQDLAQYAYSDTPLPIGEGQTISQPFIVGYMTQMLGLKATDKVLEIGTGSGYQAAVLAEIVHEVYTIEILPNLGRQAERTLKRLGYSRVHVRIGDGYRGWPEQAPFDAIIVTCAPEKIPSSLIDQLKMGGRMMIPVGKEVGEEGGGSQELILVRKSEKGIHREKTMEVRFVPMIGEAARTSLKNR